MPVDPRFFAPFNLGELMRNAEAIRGSQSDREFRQHTMRQQIATAEREAAGRAALGSFITGEGLPAAPAAAPTNPFAPHEGTHPGSLGSMIPAPQPAAAPQSSQASMAAAIRAGADPAQVLAAHRALRGETPTPTNIQREVEYYRSIGRNDLAEQVLTRHAEGPPIVANNGDGTFTIVPRSQVGGGQSGGMTATNPQTGERIRLNPQTGQWEPLAAGGAGSGQPNFPDY